MKTLLSTTLLASALVLAGCGGGDKSSAAAPSKPAAAPAAESTAPDGTRVIHLTGDDTMHYNITTIEATPGESLRVELENIGHMPKQSMSHNFTLVQPMNDADLTAFGMAASMAAPTYLPKDMSKVIVHSKLAGSGETVSVDFKAPTEPGEYPYICTFPGHFATMRGKLIVK